MDTGKIEERLTKLEEEMANLKQLQNTKAPLLSSASNSQNLQKTISWLLGLVSNLIGTVRTFPAGQQREKAVATSRKILQLLQQMQRGETPAPPEAPRRPERGRFFTREIRKEAIPAETFAAKPQIEIIPGPIKVAASSVQAPLAPIQPVIPVPVGKIQMGETPASKPVQNAVIPPKPRGRPRKTRNVSEKIAAEVPKAKGEDVGEKEEIKKGKVVFVEKNN